MYMQKKIIAGVAAFAIAFGAVGLPAAESGISFGGSSISASANTYGDFGYNIICGGTVQITSYSGTASTVKIPSKIAGSKVTSIGAYAFYDKSSVKKVVVPSGVTEIGEGAFCYCENLTSVSLPDTLTEIGDSAFSYCFAMKSITIPKGVTEIGERALFYCTSLEKITVSSENTRFSSADGVLFNKRKNELIAYPIGNSRKTYKIPSSVISVLDYAFANCQSLTSMTIPENAAVIGSYAFSLCGNLKSVKLPDKMKVICEGTFDKCSKLTSVTFGESNAMIGAYAFNGCSSLKKVTLPKSMEYIGDSAFDSCTSLNSINIPSGVTEVGELAFYNCPNLPTLTVPKSVTKIGSYAFGFGYFDGDSETYVKTAGFTLKCYSGSAAAKYAKKYGISYKKLHSHTYKTTKTVKPTLKTRGYTLKTCSVCGATTKTNYTAKLISVAKCSSSAEKIRYVYTGKAITPAVTVKYGKTTLKKGTDYTLKYTSNVNSGKAKITITGKGKYGGSTAVYFYIVPAKETVTAVSSPESAKVKVTWKKDSQASGYEIFYSSRSDFSTNKTVTVSQEYAAKTLTGLVSGRTYYVKVRAFNTVGSTKHYGAYSDVKSVKCK